MAETDAAAPERVDESMSVEDVAAFLGSHGIPGCFWEAFEGNATVRGSVRFFHNLCLLSDNYIDGAEFLTLTESEVKAIIPPIGLARKVMRLLPQREVTIASVLSFNKAGRTRSSAPSFCMAYVLLFSARRLSCALNAS